MGIHTRETENVHLAIYWDSFMGVDKSARPHFYMSVSEKVDISP
jgi:hypothetical protein